MRLALRHALAFLAAHPLGGVLGDFVGPSFPPPKDLSSDQSLVPTAWKSLTDVLKAAGLGDDGTSNSGSPANSSAFPEATRNTTFSIGLFSLHDPDAASIQFHHTSPEIAASTEGTKKVDGNSIYRVASVTKVFTVLAGLLSLSDDEWERPLSNILAPLSNQNTHASVLSTPWDKITMRALAAQLGGVARDGFPNLGEIALRIAMRNQTEADLMSESGLPPSNPSDPLSNPPCLLLFQTNGECTETPYLEGIANRAPTFLPWTSPGYSNNGFILLGRAMANATNQTIANLYQDKILSPLSMKSTFSDPPPPADLPRSVIVTNAKTSAFDLPNGIFISSGGIFSTTSDLALFGTAILNSTLLPLEQTHRWLKPVTHTAQLQYAVGAPWEIMRYISPSGKVTDLYTKLGDAGLYSAWLVLVPEYGVGFSILSAGSSRGRFNVVAALADAVSHALLPALEQQAAAETATNFAGVYKPPASSPDLNSTLVLTAEYESATAPGLVVSSWVSNGTDVLPYLARVVGPGPFRLLPSIAEGADGKVAFRLVGAVDAPSGVVTAGGKLFSGPGMASADWFVGDASTYYGVGLSLFVFDVGGDGRATAVNVAAYRASLIRSGE